MDVMSRQRTSERGQMRQTRPSVLPDPWQRPNPVGNGTSRKVSSLCRQTWRNSACGHTGSTIAEAYLGREL
jgi:hypothetical protein